MKEEIEGGSHMRFSIFRIYSNKLIPLLNLWSRSLGTVASRVRHYQYDLAKKPIVMQLLPNAHYIEPTNLQHFIFIIN